MTEPIRLNLFETALLASVPLGTFLALLVVYPDYFPIGKNNLAILLAVLSGPLLVVIASLMRRGPVLGIAASLLGVVATILVPSLI